MPVCPICDAEEFEEVEGLYYCSVCQTQSQALRVEELDDDQDQTHHTTRYTLPAKGSGSSTKVLDHGRPWSTNEAFQFILRTQVDALIHLGAKECLRDVMFELWKLYLCEAGRAFCADSSIVTARGRLRDLHLPKQEKAVVRPVRLKRTLAKKASATAMIRQAQAKQEQEGLSSVIGEEEFYEGDNPIEDVQKELDAEEELECDSSQEEEEEGGSERYQVWHMSMPLTLAFCYLAMLHTKHLVSEATIVKWVQSGQLPYNQAANHLPENFKFSNADFQTFCSQPCPSCGILRRLTGRLARYLGMKKFPAPSIKDLIHVYICQLELPGEFHGLVSSLWAQFPVQVAAEFRGSVVSVPPYGGLAMAYVILVMKLMFGLNDVTERQLSSYAREICRDVTTNQTLFIWDDWVWHMMRMMAQHDSSHRPQTLLGAIASGDPGACLQDETSEETQRYSHYRDTRHRYQQTIKASLLRPLSSLEELMGEQEATPGSIPRGQHTPLPDPNPFPSSTVQYVSQAYEFLAYGGNHGLAEATLADAQPAASPHTPSPSDSPTPGSSQKRPLSSPEGDGSGKRVAGAVAAVRHALLQGLRHETQRDTPPDSRAANLSHHLAQAGSKYALYPSIETVPATYRWLLRLCSHMTGWQPEGLGHLVYTLELMMLVPTGQRTIAQNNCIRRAQPVFTVIPQ